MKMFEILARKSCDLNREINKPNFHPGREILINAQMHLFLQVSGENAGENSLIPGGYFGEIYSKSLMTLTNLIQLIECEENSKAIKASIKQPFSIPYKH